MNLPETATFSEFARLARFRPSYVTQLRKDGRLVLTDDSKQVRVAESLARIAATKDPSKIGVVERHAEARGTTVLPEDAPAEDGPYDEVPGVGPPPAYQESRAAKEYWQAKAAERDYLVSIGKLLDAAEVVDAVSHAVTTMRVSLESLPDTIGPSVAAEQDEARCRAMLSEAIEQALDECARRFHGLVRESGS